MNGYWRSILFAGAALNLFGWGLAMSEGWVLLPGTFAAGIGCAEFLVTRRAKRADSVSGNHPAADNATIERIQALELEIAELASQLHRLRAEHDFDRQLTETRGSSDANPSRP